MPIKYLVEMSAAEIEQHLREVDDQPTLQNVKREICLNKDTVMCLVFKSRSATKTYRKFQSNYSIIVY